MTPTLTDLAWLAGIIDGEGTVVLTHGSSGTPSLSVVIYNSDEAILGKVRRILDELGLTWFDKWDRRHSRAACVISMGAQAAMVIYEHVRPFMVRQVDRFDAAIAFLAPRYANGRRRVYWSPAERAEWETIRARFLSHPKFIDRRVVPG